MQHLVAVISRKLPIAGMAKDRRYPRGAADDSTGIVP
jgi:hypothetical protein